jgi:hypothetical protein
MNNHKSNARNLGTLEVDEEFEEMLKQQKLAQKILDKLNKDTINE